MGQALISRHHPSMLAVMTIAMHIECPSRHYQLQLPIWECFMRNKDICPILRRSLNRLPCKWRVTHINALILSSVTQSRSK